MIVSALRLRDIDHSRATERSLGKVNYFMLNTHLTQNLSPYTVESHSFSGEASNSGKPCDATVYSGFLNIHGLLSL